MGDFGCTKLKQNTLVQGFEEPNLSSYLHSRRRMCSFKLENFLPSLLLVLSQSSITRSLLRHQSLVDAYLPALDIPSSVNNQHIGYL
jgi:hypothetical protein